MSSAPIPAWSARWAHLDRSGGCYDKGMRESKPEEAAGVVIAIDGPAGAGKSTVARELARRLGMGYLDTGAMYRALTLEAMRRRMDLDDAPALSSLAATMNLDIAYVPGESPPHRVLVDGEDVTAAVRTREVSAHVSQVSSHAEVRAEMVRKQRALARGRDVVVEGRDVGTVVFPRAPVKFFVTASVAERARRRHEEMAKEGYEVSLEAVRQDMVRRDHMDATREVNPLRRAPDAEVVDTTGMSVSQVVDGLLARVEQKLGKRDGGT